MQALPVVHIASSIKDNSFCSRKLKKKRYGLTLTNKNIAVFSIIIKTLNLDDKQ